MDGLELRSRREIYQEIESAPGIHFSELRRRFEYAQGTLQYHLRWLVDEGLIESDDDGEFTRYYPARSFEPEDKDILNALRREYSRRILVYLALDGPLSTSELAERIDKATSTVSWHLGRLHEAGIVTKERDGRAVLYSLENPTKVKRLYATYDRSFGDRLLDSVVNLWDSY